MVAALCAAFLLSHFYRASVGVLAPTFMVDMGLTARMLGIMGSTYFIVFAIAQVPCGVLLDHYGPRLVNTALLIVAAAGALVFATATGPIMLSLGRGIIGLGCATCFMGALVVFSRWFPPKRFPMMAAIASGVGGGGALFATSPLAITANWLGWRGTFFGMAAITALVAIFVWLLVRNTPKGESFHEGPRETLASALGGVRKIASYRELHLLLPLNAVSYGSIMVVLGLWGAPYLRDVHGFTMVSAAHVLMAMALSTMAGALGYAWLAPRLGSIKILVVAGGSLSVSLFIVLATLPATHQYFLLPLLSLLGLVGSYPVLIISHVRMLAPINLVGRALTLSNLFSFGGVGLLQILSGWIVGFFPLIEGVPSPHAYSTLFWGLAGLSTVAVLFYSRTQDPDLERLDSA